MTRDLRRIPEFESPSICSIGAAIGLIGGIGSAIIGSSSASNAADAQTQAANTAAQTQLQMYNQTRKDLMPYMNVGNSAESQLASLYGLGTGAGGTNTAPNYQAMQKALENTPGYQFTLSQGQSALDRSAASRGMVLSGSQLQAAQQFGQNTATVNAWQPYITQLNALANSGQNSAAKVGDQGSIAASNAGSAQLAGGSAAAAGAYNTGTALSSGLTQSLYALQSGLSGGGGFGYVPAGNGAAGIESSALSQYFG